METRAMESCGRQVLRKMRRLNFILFLPCVLGTQYAAALIINEAVPDVRPATGHLWFAGAKAAGASAPGRLLDEKKLVWSLPAGYMLVVGMGNRAEPDKFPQIYSERVRMPRIGVRIERRF